MRPGFRSRTHPPPPPTPPPGPRCVSTRTGLRCGDNEASSCGGVRPDRFTSQSLRSRGIMRSASRACVIEWANLPTLGAVTRRIDSTELALYKGCGLGRRRNPRTTPVGALVAPFDEVFHPHALGASLIECHTKLRLSRASTALATTATPIRDIAHEFGY